MVDDTQKTDVAKKFAKLHLSAFVMWSRGRDHNLNEYYLTVFDDLIAGVYCECYGVNAEFDGDGNQIMEATKYEVTVDQYDLRESKPELFCFEITLGKFDGGRIIEEYEADDS